MKNYKSLLTGFLVFFSVCVCTTAYAGEVPIIGSITVAAPGSGMSGYVGCKVTLRGIGFTNIKYVRIGKAVVANFTIESDFIITFKAIAHSGIISIQTKSGTGAYFGTEYTDLGLCLPGTAYAVRGGGLVCNESVSVSLPNSQQGYMYTLLCDGLDTGKSIEGTGTGIQFDDLTKAGSYTVKAVSLKCKLESEMSGSAIIEKKRGVTLYVDADNDGYGNSKSEGKYWCEGRTPDGFATNNLDCNDSNPAISPKATEIIGNKIDDNCDGIIDREIVEKPAVAQKKTAPATNVVKTTTAKSSVYSNPFDKSFTVDVVCKKDSVVKIYNVLGKLLDTADVPMSAEPQSFEFGSEYPSGVYKVIIVSGDRSKVFQVIKR